MTQKDKQLLLRDLCARLPYGVKIAVNDGSEYWTLKGMFENEHTGLTLILEQRFPSKNVYPNTSNFPLSICKPYLRPMESMTEREKVKYLDLLTEYHFSDSYDDYVIYDWLNKKMFDFRGLIKKGLAIEVNDKDLTTGGFVEKKFDELQEELDAIKKRIAKLEEKEGETQHPYPAFPDNFPCDGTTCTNPLQDCINCPRRFVGKGQHEWFTATDISNCPGRKKCD